MTKRRRAIVGRASAWHREVLADQIGHRPERWSSHGLARRTPDTLRLPDGGMARKVHTVFKRERNRPTIVRLGSREMTRANLISSCQDVSSSPSNQRNSLMRRLISFATSAPCRFRMASTRSFRSSSSSSALAERSIFNWTKYPRRPRNVAETSHMSS